MQARFTVESVKRYQVPGSPEAANVSMVVDPKTGPSGIWAGVANGNLGLWGISANLGTTFNPGDEYLVTLTKVSS